MIIFIDLYLLCTMNFYTYFISNDYLFLQNIESVNIRSNQYNLKQTLLQKEIANAKAQIMQGGGQGIGANQSMIDRAKDMVKKA